MFVNLINHKSPHEDLIGSLEALQPSSDEYDAFPSSDPKSAKKNTIYVYKGLKLYLEKLEGDIRKGVAKDGKAWANKLPAAYGYIPNTKDADQEDIDVYVAQSTFVDSNIVYVIDQIIPETKAFDEHKVMVGFGSEDDAKEAYNKAFGGHGLSRIGAITAITIEQLLSWICTDGPMTPMAGQGISAQEQGSVSKAAANLPDRARTLFLELPKLGRAPFVTTSVDAKTGAVQMRLNVITPFVSTIWGQTIEVVIQFLGRAVTGDTLIIALASPGGEVTLASRLSAAIRKSKATTLTVAVGGVASAACMVWAEGDRRYLSPVSYLMQHMSSHGEQGPTVSIERNARAIKEYVKSAMLSRALDIKLITEEDLDEMVENNRNVYLSADEVSTRTGAKIIRSWADVK